MTLQFCLINQIIIWFLELKLLPLRSKGCKNLIMKTIKENKRNTAIPGHPMTETEFRDFIKVGENGSFMSSSEFKKKFDVWRKGLEK